jgi:hypothetical protein
MNSSRRVVLSILTSLVLVAALSAISPAIGNAQTASPLSVSGKITSVAKDSFILAVGGSQTSVGQQIAQASETKSMTFSIDKNTTIEGKLKVNAKAEVTYREDNGKNIAISVHVTP